MFQEYLERENKVLDRLENAIQIQYQQAQANPVGDSMLFRRQLEFISEESDQIQQRREVLQEALETFSKAKFSFEQKLYDAEHWQRKID